jgi:hypothetical protein
VQYWRLFDLPFCKFLHLPAQLPTFIHYLRDSETVEYDIEKARPKLITICLKGPARSEVLYTINHDAPLTTAVRIGIVGLRAEYPIKMYEDHREQMAAQVACNLFGAGGEAKPQQLQYPD